ncbi:hypothetical protein [Streptococcus sp.]|uniref:hypothetical protein n=1 Tax=Streptococcus sp. TaxID=1306 RepID=UPI0025F4C39C|nr:hypothetical protein [Streptococcus sp.]MDU4481335.1 hypothetical protein [Streptococcus vestibularis]MDU4508770.1 hypothetical protein [Streptococcus sp.]
MELLTNSDSAKAKVIYDITVKNVAEAIDTKNKILKNSLSIEDVEINIECDTAMDVDEVKRWSS